MPASHSQSTSELAYRTRKPARYARDRVKVLAAFASFDRELTMGEVTCYALNITSSVDRDEVLNDLVVEGLLLVRSEACSTARDRIRRIYRRPQSQEGQR